MMKITGTRLLSCHKQLENCYESLDENQYRTDSLVKRRTKKVSPTILSTFCLVAFSGQHSGRRNLRRSWSQWVEEAEIRVCRGWGVTGVCIVKDQRGEGYAGKESQRYAWGPLVLWNTKWVMQKGKKSMRLRKEWHGICMLKIPSSPRAGRCPTFNQPEWTEQLEHSGESPESSQFSSGVKPPLK